MSAPRLVFDTKLLVSLLVFPGGIIEEIFRGVVARDCELGISEPILDELDRVLREKFGWPPLRRRRIAAFLRRNATLVVPAVRLTVIRDEPDNRILECAVAFRARLIISGAHHLLELKRCRRIRIVKPSEFLKLHCNYSQPSAFPLLHHRGRRSG